MPRWLFLLLVIALYQLLIWVFLRSSRWLFGSVVISRVVVTMVFLLCNTLLVIAVTRIFHGGFAVFASILALLWIWLMVASVIAVVNLVSAGRIDNVLRVLLPIGFCIVVAWGWFNAHSPVVRHFSITLDKPTVPLRILVASDLHLGVQMENNAINRLVNIINEENKGKFTTLRHCTSKQQRLHIFMTEHFSKGKQHYKFHYNQQSDQDGYVHRAFDQ